MENLSQIQQQTIHTFHGLLEQIVSVDDIFPPDDEGVREPRGTPLPRPQLSGQIVLREVMGQEVLSYA